MLAGIDDFVQLNGLGTPFSAFNEYFSGSIDTVQISQGAVTADDVNGGSIAVEPLPAGLFLLVGGLASLGVTRRWPS